MKVTGKTTGSAATNSQTRAKAQHPKLDGAGSDQVRGSRNNPDIKRSRQETPRESHQIRRACAELLSFLPQLKTDSTGKIDFRESPGKLLEQLADNAALTVEIFNKGVGAIGNLMAYAAPEIDDGSVAPETVEALGWFLAEIGDFSALLLALSMNCRCGKAGLA